MKQFNTKIPFMIKISRLLYRGLFGPSRRYTISLWLLVWLTAGPLLAQKTPASATLTAVNRQATKFSPTEKIPQKIIFRYKPCKMANGVDDRPFPCEFHFDKLEIYGKNGLLLATVTSENSTISLPFRQAKGVPSSTVITYSAKAYFSRINLPSFPVKKGYLLERSGGVNATENTDVTTLLTGIAIGNTLGKVKPVTFNLTWPHTASGEALFAVHIENDVTKNHFMPKPGTTLAMHDIAEATMIVNPQLVK